MLQCKRKQLQLKAALHKLIKITKTYASVPFHQQKLAQSGDTNSKKSVVAKFSELSFATGLLVLNSYSLAK